jgi:uncharacterized protein YjbI with pentapeptide repeats
MEINEHKVEPGADLSDANLIGAYLTGAKLTNANLVSANLRKSAVGPSLSNSLEHKTLFLGKPFRDPTRFWRN